MNGFRWKNFIYIGAVVCIITIFIFSFLFVRKLNEYKSGDVIKDDKITYEVHNASSLISNGICSLDELQLPKDELFAVIKGGSEFKGSHLIIPKNMRNIYYFIIKKQDFVNNINIVNMDIYGNLQVLDSGFENCGNIKGINVYSESYFDKHSFKGCRSLNNVFISDSGGYVFLSEGTFSNCESLREYNFGNSLFLNNGKLIYESPFSYCIIEKFIGVEKNSNKNSITEKILDYYNEEGYKLYYMGIPVYYNPNKVSSLHIFSYDPIFNIIGCNYNVEEYTTSLYNPDYACVDGVLYSKDLKTLLLYPNAKDKIEILDSVTAIGPGAFAGEFVVEKVILPKGILLEVDSFYQTNLIYEIED